MSEKVQKVLASLGYGSRRALEKWIEAERISINDRVAQLGDRVEPDDRIQVDGKPVDRGVQADVTHRVILYNKPPGQICSRNDPEGRPTVFTHLPALKGQRWVSVGRLDINTAGLLLFTTDGELAHRLMHPSRAIEREYVVRVKGTVDDEMITRLLGGVELEDGVAKFSDIRPGRGEGTNRWYYVVLMEGRNREVRRLWESQGLMVSRLKRVRYGNIFIPSRIRAGKHADLTPEEIQGLYRLAELKPKPMALSLEKRAGEKRPGEKRASGQKSPGNRAPTQSRSSHPTPRSPGRSRSGAADSPRRSSRGEAPRGGRRPSGKRGR